MARLKILTFPDPRLRKVALPVKEFNKSLIKITENMLETMYDAGWYWSCCNSSGYS